MQTQPGWKPYRNVVLGALFLHLTLLGKIDTYMQSIELDTVKLYTVAHGSKVNIQYRPLDVKRSLTGTRPPTSSSTLTTTSGYWTTTRKC
jgi:hypothetical protein